MMNDMYRVLDTVFSIHPNCINLVCVLLHLPSMSVRLREGDVNICRTQRHRGFYRIFPWVFFQLFTQAICKVQDVSIETGFEAYMEIVIL